MSMDQLERRLGPIPSKNESSNPFVEAMEGEDMSQFEDDLASPDATPEDAVENFESQEPVDRATSRVGRILQNMSDRIENGSVHADNVSERAAELKEKATTKIKGFGRSALTRLKTAGTITLGLGLLGAEAGARGAKKGYEATIAGAKKSSEVMGDKFIAGLKATERGLDAGAAKVTSKVDSAKEIWSDYQDVRERKATDRAEAKRIAADEKWNEKNRKAREKAAALEAARLEKETNDFYADMDADRGDSNDEYQLQLAALEAERAQQEREFLKQDKADAKQASKDLRDFNKILDKKERADARRERKEAALARRAERRAKWSSSYNALKNTVKDGVEIAANTSKDLYESGRDKASELSERAKTKARVSKVAAKMALQTYRDTKESFKS